MQIIKLPLLIIIVAYVFIINVNYKQLEAYLIQDKLTNAIMSNNFSGDLNFLKGYDYNYPSLTNTTIPIKAIVGRFFYDNDSTELGKKLIMDGIKDNPYIMFSEAQLADIFDKENQRDSFVKYSNKAFKKLPNNPIHFVMYSRKLIGENKTDSVLYYFDQIRKNASTADFQIWKIALGALVDNNDSTLVDKKKSILDEYKKQNFLNQELAVLAAYAEYGSSQVKLAISIHDEALKAFNNGEIEDSYDLFNTSIEIYPSQKFYENLIKAYYTSENFLETVRTYDKYSLKFNQSNSITTSQYAVALYNLGRISESCAVIKHLQTYTNISFPSQIISGC